MYSTTAKMELSDIIVSELRADSPLPKLVIEKRTGKIFTLTIKFSYGGGEISDVQIVDLRGSEKPIHLRLIDLKQYYFINEIKKVGGYNTAMEPTFRTMSFSDIIVEWYDYNREIPVNDTWMVNPLALLPVSGNFKLFGKATPTNQVLAFKGIPNFKTGITDKGDVEVDNSSSWCVMRSFTLNGELIYSNRIIL